MSYLTNDNHKTIATIMVLDLEQNDENVKKKANKRKDVRTTNNKRSGNQT